MRWRKPSWSVSRFCLFRGGASLPFWKANKFKCFWPLPLTAALVQLDHFNWTIGPLHVGHRGVSPLCSRIVLTLLLPNASMLAIMYGWTQRREELRRYLNKPDYNFHFFLLVVRNRKLTCHTGTWFYIKRQLWGYLLKWGRAYLERKFYVKSHDFLAPAVVFGTTRDSFEALKAVYPSIFFNEVVARRKKCAVPVIFCLAGE